MTSAAFWALLALTSLVLGLSAFLWANLKERDGVSRAPWERAAWSTVSITMLLLGIGVFLVVMIAYSLSNERQSFPASFLKNGKWYVQQ